LPKYSQAELFVNIAGKRREHHEKAWQIQANTIENLRARTAGPTVLGTHVIEMLHLLAVHCS